MLIKNKKITNITRNTTKLKLIIYKTLKIKLFCIHKKTKPAFDILNRKTIRSRKKSSFNLFWNVLQKPVLNRCPNLVTRICFSTKLYKFISIIKNATGVIYSKITLESHKLFSYFLFLPKKKLLKNLYRSGLSYLPYNSFLIYTPRRAFISFVEISFNKGAQYARAVGSKARLLELYTKQRLCAVQLPSKEVKIFSGFGTCNNSLQYLKTLKNLQFDNKRYKRLSGFGPKVRGVAMNAIDHPHGGKTKSIKFPKTPWGLPTKLK